MRDGEEELKEEPKKLPDALVNLQRIIGEVVSVTSLEILDDTWLTGDERSRATKKHDLLLSAMRSAKTLEGEFV